MEFILKSAEINLPQSIANLKELKDELSPKLEKYNNLVVTADSIKEAKADKAALNKLKTAIEDQRKAIKKQYLEPYMILETQCKEVVALIDAPIQAIDKQIKVFDEMDENNKYSELESYFTSLNAPEWIKLDEVINPKWRNKTAKLDTLKQEIKTAVETFRADFDRLGSIYGAEPYFLSIAEHYKKIKDFSKTAVYAAELKTAHEREKQEKLKAQMLAAAAETKAEITQSVQNASEPSQPVMNDSIPVQQPTAEKAATASATGEKMYKGKFEVEGTADQIKALGQFMKANNIKFVILK